MAQPPPFIFSLLNLPMLAGMTMFIVVRRPRQLLTWAFAGVMTGLMVFYLADVVLYQPDTSAEAGLVWQFILNQGANVTILSALAVNWLLRDRHLERWEWAIVGFIVVRMAIDTTWLAGFVRPEVLQPCVLPAGLPRLTCPPGDRLAIALAAFSGVLVLVLFVSTAYKAPEPRRNLLRRYILRIALLIAVTSVSLQVLVLAGKDDLGVVPTGPTTLLASLIGLRLFLALEETETGVRFPVLGWRILVWFFALILAVLLDLTLGWLNAPVWTLIVLAAGMAGGGAWLINVLMRQGEPAQKVSAESQPVAPPAPLLPAPTPWRIYLLGPMRVAREGEILPNTPEVWRSAKTRSLLALLALYGPRGAAQIEIVDALWPLDESLSREELSKAEHHSLTNLRSYLSTLRRVLEPDGPRGSERYVELIDGRYRLRQDSGIWVDVWQFEALATQAEKERAAGRTTESIAGWEEAMALYPVEGLLPAERYLTTAWVEAQRERLRQRGLLGLRRLVKHYAEHGPVERAAEWRRLLREIERLGEES